MAAKNGTSPRALARMRAFGDLPADAALCELRPLLNRRPAKKVSDLPANWMEIMAESSMRGEGPHSWIVYLDISHTALNNLLRDEPDFAAHYEKCLRVQRAWFENAGRAMMLEGQGLPAIWTMFMANQYGWKNTKTELSGDAQNPVVVKQQILDSATEEELKAYADEC